MADAVVACTVVVVAAACTVVAVASSIRSAAQRPAGPHLPSRPVDVVVAGAVVAVVAGTKR
jgi:hypothetical protein